MFGQDGNFLVNIVMDGVDEDFIERDDLHELTIIEEAGNVLPTFILSFDTAYEQVLSKLNDGAIIKASMGTGLEDLEEYELSVSTFASERKGADLITISCNGFASKINYITDQGMQITDKKSGIEVAIEEAGKYFKVDSNIKKSKDKMNWVQPSTSYKAFINNCLMHSSIPDSFVSCVITASGKFIIRDVKKYIKDLGGKFDWKFTNESDGNKDIVIDSGEELQSNGGFINSWIGYKRIGIANIIESGGVSEISAETKNLLSLSDAVGKAKSIKDRFNGSKILSSNVDENYWKSYESNLKGLANMSRIEIPVSFTGHFKSVVPLQVVMYKQGSTLDSSSSEYTSGLYIISKVIKTIQSNIVNITCVLNREEMNIIKEDEI